MQERRQRRLISLVLTVLGTLGLTAAQAQEPAAKIAENPPTNLGNPPDLSKQATLYVVGYAHLDTEWRWEYPQTIEEFLSKTMRNNFALI
jgi:hypothetical protein